MRSEAGIIAALTVVVVAAAMIVLRLTAPADPLNADHDIPHYATVLVSADPGVTFERDPIFAGRARLVWRAAAGYMAVFRAMYIAAGRDFGRTLILFQLLLVAVYFPSMTCFLRRCGASLGVAVAVASISLIESAFLVTGTRWGIFTPPVPLVVCTTLSPLIAWIAMRWPLAAGTAIAIPIVLINPATGLALIELAIVIAFIAALLRKWSWLHFGGTAVSAAIWIVVAQLNLAATTHPFSFADAAEMIRYGQDNVMVFPFRGAGVSSIGVVLAVHAVLSLAFLVLRKRLPFIGVQAAYALFFLRAGWLVLLPLACSFRKRGADVWLWLVLGVSIVIGPLQQIAFLALFERLHATALTALVFEGARFLQFSYLVLFVLVAQAIDAFAAEFSRLRLAVVAFLAIGAALNLNVSPADVRVGSLWILTVSVLWMSFDRWRPWFDEEIDRMRSIVAIAFGVAALLAFTAVLAKLGIRTVRAPLAVAGCTTLVLFALAHSKRDARAFAAACLFAAVIGGPWLLLALREPVGTNSLGFELKLPRAERGRAASAPRCGYRSLTQRLPATAVFHVLTFDRAFRAETGRAMLPVSDEWLIPIYDGAPISKLRAESDALWKARTDLTATETLAKVFGADYVVTCNAVYSLN